MSRLHHALSAAYLQRFQSRRSIHIAGFRIVRVDFVTFLRCLETHPVQLSLSSRYRKSLLITSRYCKPRNTIRSLAVFSGETFQPRMPDTRYLDFCKAPRIFVFSPLVTTPIYTVHSHLSRGKVPRANLYTKTARHAKPVPSVRLTSDPRAAKSLHNRPGALDSSINPRPRKSQATSARTTRERSFGRTTRSARHVVTD